MAEAMSNAERAVRRKQMLVLGGVLSALAGAGVLFAVLTASDGPTTPKGKVEKTVFKVGAGASDKEAFAAQFAAAQDELKKELEELKRWRDAQQKEQERANKEARSTPPVPPALLLPPPAPPPQAAAPTQPKPVPPPPTSAPAQTQPKPPAPAVRMVQVAALAEATKKSDDRSGPSGNMSGVYVPAGSFARAIMLNGLDAPTGGNAQQNPHPIVLRLADDAVMPNDHRGPTRACFVTGAGHGDISSERAYLRLDRLSCIDDKGETLDVKVQGYVAGEDGKTGVRGRLVTKSGQVLANALLTGLLSGIGKGIQQSATQQTTTVMGAVTSQVSDPFRAGIGEGAGRALEELSRYYLRLADKIFPVIEVDAGREVDVVLTRGVSLEPTIEKAEAQK
ncbi:MAG TPA: TraB/VirB10 family protein [Burkholderiaceae bacterium]|nr:TraB/VirB10 family protein [Burkholderiaceae bacterium]